MKTGQRKTAEHEGQAWMPPLRVDASRRLFSGSISDQWKVWGLYPLVYQLKGCPRGLRALGQGK